MTSEATRANPAAAPPRLEPLPPELRAAASRTARLLDRWQRGAVPHSTLLGIVVAAYAGLAPTVDRESLPDVAERIARARIDAELRRAASPARRSDS